MDIVAAILLALAGGAIGGLLGGIVDDKKGKK